MYHARPQTDCIIHVLHCCIKDHGDNSFLYLNKFHSNTITLMFIRNKTKCLKIHVYDLQCLSIEFFCKQKY